VYGLAPSVIGGFPTILAAVQAAGLQTACQLCLDASDPASFPGSGQAWNDVSGKGNHFWLGDGNTVEADPDPVWTSNSEQSYFASNANNASRFTFAGSMAGHFFNTLHKSTWDFTYLFIEDWNGTNYGSGFSTKPGAINDNTSRGTSVFRSSGNYTLFIGSGSSGFMLQNAASLVAGTPGLQGLGFRKNGLANHDNTRMINSQWSFQNSTNSFTASGTDVTGTFKLGGTNDGSSNLSAGRKIYGFVMFDRQITQAEYDAFRAVLGSRFPTILT
jgi:hypothetical protein